MTHELGTRLGPYELLAPIGAGGMGQVYRARDTRLGRDVAIKILPTATASEPDRVRRFEQEARAASSIEHPAVLTVHDVGVEGGVRFLVTELLEGETVRARLARAPLPPAEVLAIASQLADGLAAAHARGVVHRDLKPENLFITHDGRLKILDFGLAQLTVAAPASDGTVSDAGTAPGAILGTAGYMSPEQVRGLPTDARTDLFSFGAILFELASGRRAFPGDTAIDRALAIVHADPPPVGRTDLPPMIDELIARCTTKSADARLQSARELARRLNGEAEERPLTTDGHTSGPSAPLVARERTRLSRPLMLGAAWAVTLLLAAVLGAEIFPPAQEAYPAEYQRITFTPGAIDNARFAPDGKNVIFTRRHGLADPRTYMLMPGLPESRQLNEGMFVHSVSRQGELVVSLIDKRLQDRASVLARVPIGGGTPRRIREGVWAADWSPDGNDLAVVIGNGSSVTLEYPLGHLVHRAEGWLTTPRVSPDGSRVAFADHPHGNDDMGYISVTDRDGNARRLTPRFGSVSGLAWMPGGREIVFTAAKSGLGRSVYFVDLGGHVRPGPRAPVDMMIQDVAADGTILLKRELMRIEVVGKRKGTEALQDLCWFDWGVPNGISDDGEHYAFVEGGAAGGQRYIAYVRGLDGSPPVRLGDGSVTAMSGDGNWVAFAPDNDRTRLSLVPTELGVTRALDPGPIRSYESTAFTPDNQSLLVLGRDDGGTVRLFRQPLSPPGPPVAIGIDTPLSATMRIETSPDGTEVLLADKGHQIHRFLLETGESRPIEGLRRRDSVARWTTANHLLVMTTTATCMGCTEDDGARELDEDEDDELPSLVELNAFADKLAKAGIAPEAAHRARAAARFAERRHLRRARERNRCGACDPADAAFALVLIDVDLDTGERTEVRRLTGPDAFEHGGHEHQSVPGLGGAAFSRDGEAYVLAFMQVSSDLYLMRL